jgi:outer membrane protein assembly factor BamB
LSQRLVIPLASESRAEPLVTSDRIYIGTESGALQVFDRATGKLDFQLTRKSPLRGQPALLGDRLVVAFVGGQLLCLNALTGEPLWELRNGEGFVGSLLSHEGRVLMATEAGLLAVDPNHGTPIKRVTVGQLPVCGPTLLDGDIFVVAGNRIVRFDARTLEALTTYTARETLNGPPALGNDRVFVSGQQGSQFCFDKKSGKLLYQSPMKEAMQGAAVATSRGILFVTGKGHAEVLAP